MTATHSRVSAFGILPARAATCPSRPRPEIRHALAGTPSAEAQSPGPERHGALTPLSEGARLTASAPQPAAGDETGVLR